MKEDAGKPLDREFLIVFAVDAKVLELYVPLILISTEYSWIGSEGGRNEDFKLSYKVTDTSCVGAC